MLKKEVKMKMKNNEWLENEMAEIELEQKKTNKRYDSKMFYKLMTLLIPILLSSMALSALSCPKCDAPINISIDQSAQWTCKSCKQFNDSKDHDWKGDYFCGNCGTRKGDE